MRVTTKELRTRVREVLDCLDRGEDVTLTYRGKPRARLTGIDDDSRDPTTDSEGRTAFGMWEDRQELDDVDEHVRELRGGRLRAHRY